MPFHRGEAVHVAHFLRGDTANLLGPDDKIESDETPAYEGDGAANALQFMGFVRNASANKQMLSSPQKPYLPPPTGTMRDLPVTLPTNLDIAYFRVPVPMSEVDYGTLVSTLAAMKNKLVVKSIDSEQLAEAVRRKAENYAERKAAGEFEDDGQESPCVALASQATQRLAQK